MQVNEHQTSLSRRDILVFEKRLLAMLQPFIAYKGHSILFPRDPQRYVCSWIAEETKLFLPLLTREGQPLGLLLLRGVSEKDATNLLSIWAALSVLCVDNLLLYKQSLCDPVTGLYSRHYLVQQLTAAIESLRIHHAGGALWEQPSHPRDLVASEGKELAFAHGGSLALLVVRLDKVKSIVREYGYQFADQLMTALATALQGICPEQALAVRTGDMEFAILVFSATAKNCQALAVTLCETLAQVCVEHPLRRNRVCVTPHVGYALYPQDADAAAGLRAAQDQAGYLLRQARLAAAFAHEHPHHRGSGTAHVLAFNSILQSGGRVLEVLPLSRVLVNVGKQMQAREGMHFSVWGQPVAGAVCAQAQTPSAVYKGEIVLIEVYEHTALAEVIYLGDPTWVFAPGDAICFVPEIQSGHVTAQAQAEHDPVSGLLRHGDFLARWIEERAHAQSFALSLLRVDLHDTTATPPERLAGTMDDVIHAISGLCREMLPHVFGGRYGIGSLIFYHSPAALEPLHTAYKGLIERVEKELPVSLGVGLSMYPFLEFSKADMLDNCHKALEYGLLLPWPHIGCLDSVALNISADKRYSMGDLFAAIQEYQYALMADAHNTLARNSLGICCAALGKYNEAEVQFQHVLHITPDDVMALYNLAFVKQRQGLDSEAFALYEACLAHDPGHAYALLRLGQIAEARAAYAQAGQYYQAASALPDGAQLTHRHFARLRMAEGNMDEAREYLHEALLADPQDAFAMQLLAHLYLMGGEDPELAASFARQSVSLRPDSKAAWLDLAKALELLGQPQQAREALLRAGAS